MQMLLLSFAGSMLAYFAFLSASSSAASAQSAAASNWPPTAAQQQALQVQIAQIVAEVTQQPMTAREQTALANLLANAPAQYQAGLPSGTKPTIAGYSSWVLAGSAAQAAVSAQTSPYGGVAQNPYGATTGAPPHAVPPNRRNRVGASPLPIPPEHAWRAPTRYLPPDNIMLGRVIWDSWNDPYLKIETGRMDSGYGFMSARYPLT
jgi:hypothetical protein